jgi:tetratricopeptide (TPR) repeat protein
MLPLLLALQLAAAGPPDKVVVLSAWMAAVEEHQGGILDDAADRVRAMSRPRLERVGIDLRTIIKLIGDPEASVFYPDPPGRVTTSRSQAIVYTRDELRVLRELAFAASGRGDANRLIKRAAALHTDIAIFAPFDGVPVTGRRGGELQRRTAFVEDGRQVALLEGVDHWQMARRLLDEVRSRPERQPDPGNDPGVRLWYRATMAHLLRNHHVDMPHFTDAVAVLPDDADVLFLAGAVRDMASAPGAYNTLAKTMSLGSAEAEMRQAELFFRRALTARPNHVEARLRLGRLLTRLGRPGDAINELRKAVSVDEPLLRYYAELFLGGALDAQRDSAGARAAYLRAVELAPSAQSPQLALSQLTDRAGDRGAALTALRRTLSTDAVDDVDPFWSYHIAAGRDADALMRRMHQTFSPEPAR